MFQPGMEAERQRQWKVQPARSKIGLGQRAACRPRGVPDGERRLAALSLPANRLVIGSNTRHEPAEPTVTMTVLIPHSARAESCDHATLVTARMATDEHFAVVCVADREARLTIVMRWAACHPAAARLPPAEGLGNGLSLHGAPQRQPRWKAWLCRSPE